MINKIYKTWQIADRNIWLVPLGYLSQKVSDIPVRAMKFSFVDKLLCIKLPRSKPTKTYPLFYVVCESQNIWDYQ